MLDAGCWGTLSDSTVENMVTLKDRPARETRAPQFARVLLHFALGHCGAGVPPRGADEGLSLGGSPTRGFFSPLLASDATPLRAVRCAVTARGPSARCPSRSPVEQRTENPRREFTRSGAPKNTGWLLREPPRIFWCPGAELNHRHADFQSAALPTELPGHSRSAFYIPRLVGCQQSIGRGSRAVGTRDCVQCPSMELLRFFLATGWVAKVVLIILVLFSLASWSVIFGKWRELTSAAKATDRFPQGLPQGLAPQRGLERGPEVPRVPVGTHVPGRPLGARGAAPDEPGTGRDRQRTSRSRASTRSPAPWNGFGAPNSNACSVRCPCSRQRPARHRSSAFSARSGAS